jgi:hypothetical protein
MRIFLSAVSAQLKQARDALASDLRAVGAEVVVQEDFQQSGHTLLEKLEQYIGSCDRLVALIGGVYGWEPDPSTLPNLPRRSYSQWEYFFAQGERLAGDRQPAIDTFVYFASADFVGSHPAAEEPAATQRQQSFVADVRRSGKDWNEFRSIDELRALVLRDGFRLAAGRAQVLQRIESVFDIRPASATTPRLATILKKRIAPLLERHRLFGGRNAELAFLDDYLNQHTNGYVFVSGGIGFGKTALLANWVRRLTDEKKDVCYHFVSRLDGDLAREDFTLRNLCQQLASIHALSGELPQDVESLRVLYSDLLLLPPPRDRVVIVIDALDEATGWSFGPDLFPHVVPDGVLVVFSARNIAGRDWLGELDLSTVKVGRIDLSALAPKDIVHLLQSAAPIAARWANDAAFVDVMHRKSGGDPFYLSYLAKDIEQGLIRSRDDLEAQPSGLSAYLNKWWEDVAQVTGDAAVKDLIGYLLVSKGKLTRDDLTSISDCDALDDFVVDRTIKLLERSIVGDEREGYALAHARFQEFVAREKIKTAAQRPYRESLLAYCRKWPEHASRYAAHHLAAHLADAGLFSELNALVSGSDTAAQWAAFRNKADGSYTGFLSDIDLAWRNTPVDAPAELENFVRLALTESSVRSLSDYVPAQLLALLVETGLWTPEMALARVEEMPREGTKAEALLALAEFLPEPLVVSAWTLAETFENEQRRERVLGGLAPYFPQDWRVRITSDLLAREASRGSVDALAELALHLPGEALAGIRTYLRQIKGDWLLALALVRLCAVRPNELSRVLVEEADHINDERIRAAALSELSWLVAPEQRDMIRAAMVKIDDVALRTRALHGLLAHLPVEVQYEVLRLGWDFRASFSPLLIADVVTQQCEDVPKEVRDLLLRLADQVREWLAAFEWNRSDETSARGLDWFRQIEGVTSSALVPENCRAKVESSGRDETTWRLALGCAMATRISELPEGVIAAIHEEARQLNDPAARAKAMACLAPCAADGNVRRDIQLEMLAAIEQVDKRSDRERLAAMVAFDLPDDLLGRALAAAVPDVPELSQTGVDGPSALRNRLRMLGTKRFSPDFVGSMVSFATELGVKVDRELWDHSLPEPIRAATEKLKDPTESADTANEVAALLAGTWRDLARAEPLSGDVAASLELNIRVGFMPYIEPKVQSTVLEAAATMVQLRAPYEKRLRSLTALRRVVNLLPSSMRRSAVLASLAPLQTIADDRAQGDVLVSLIGHTSPRVAAEIRNSAWDAILRIDNGLTGEERLIRLLRRSAQAAVGGEIELIEALTDPWKQMRLLLRGAGFLRAETEPRAWALIRGMGFAGPAEAGLRGVVPQLSATLQREALEHIRNTPDVQERIRYLLTLSASLDPECEREVQQEALSTAASVSGEAERGRALQSASYGLMDSLQDQLLIAAHDLTDPDVRYDTLASIVTDLQVDRRTEIVDEVLRGLPAITSDWRKQYAIKHVARDVPIGMLPTARAGIETISDLVTRAETVAVLAAGASGTARTELEADAVARIRALAEGDGRTDGLIRMLGYTTGDLHDELCQEALNGASIDGPMDQKTVSTRVYWLEVIARHAPQALGRQALDKAEELVASLTDEAQRARHRDRLRWIRIGQDRKDDGSENLEQPRSREEFWPKVLAQVGLALRRVRTCSEVERPEAIKAALAAVARTESSQYDYVPFLEDLVGLVAPDLRRQFGASLLDLVQRVREAGKRAALTLDVGMPLPDAQWIGPMNDAVGPTLGHANEGISKDLRLVDASGAVNLRACNTLLHRLARRRRPDALSGLSAVMPLLIAAAGQQAGDSIQRTVSDVVRSWP